VPTLDTNVLVRLLVADDVRQAEQAAAVVREAVEAGDPLFLPLTVVLELEWVLRSRHRFRKDVVLATLVKLLESREIEFQDEASLERALFFYRSRKADFAECLHLGCAVTHDRMPLVTFDCQAARLDGTKLLRS
jgi:predicted nucleic-acid-binding protein